MIPPRRRSVFRSAADDEARARAAPDTPQTRSPSYRLSFADPDFLTRDELRPVRLQLELLKPELLLAEQGIDATVVIFGSARNPDPADRSAAAQDRRRDYEAARRLGRLVSEGDECPERLVVVTGGGPGVMEAGNRGAADAGAANVGLNIVLPHEQAPNAYITPELCFQFHYFALRKMHFLMRARALVCFPGGFGTMDELFETLTLVQTGKIEPIPILLYRRTWWERLVDFRMMADAGMIAHADLDLFSYVESAEDAWDRIRAYCCRRRSGELP